MNSEPLRRTRSNPIYFAELEYAALSLDKTGLRYYGPYCVTLKEAVIQLRASVFEENLFVFNRRHKVVSGEQVPAGHRAAWPERALLSVAKLAHRIGANTSTEDFLSILMGNDRDKASCDFIEVHIYDKLHRKAIQSVTGSRPTTAIDQFIWDATKEAFAMIGVVMEEVLMQALISGQAGAFALLSDEHRRSGISTAIALRCSDRSSERPFKIAQILSWCTSRMKMKLGNFARPRKVDRTLRLVLIWMDLEGAGASAEKSARLVEEAFRRFGGSRPNSRRNVRGCAAPKH